MKFSVSILKPLILALIVLSIVALVTIHSTVAFTNMRRALGTNPQASFTYYPGMLRENMTVTCDASSSSAEGDNDTIISFEWTFYDEYNPEHVIVTGNYTNPPSPYVAHNFPHWGTFTVDLNVTDNEGLWSTASNPITVLPEFGPVANFTYEPDQAYANKTEVTFDASLSTLGWSRQIGGYSPIVQYIWNFSDRTGNITTADPVINHTFAMNGTLRVYLTIRDSAGRTNTTYQNLFVFYYEFKWDVTGDGYVGIDDIYAVAIHFGLSSEDPGWDPLYDITGDGYIGIDDLFEVASHFGETWP
jgi:hypothetical protein